MQTRNEDEYKVEEKARKQVVACRETERKAKLNSGSPGAFKHKNPNAHLPPATTTNAPSVTPRRTKPVSTPRARHRARHLHGAQNRFPHRELATAHVTSTAAALSVEPHHLSNPRSSAHRPIAPAPPLHPSRHPPSRPTRAATTWHGVSWRKRWNLPPEPHELTMPVRIPVEIFARGQLDAEAIHDLAERPKNLLSVIKGRVAETKANQVGKSSHL